MVVRYYVSTTTRNLKGEFCSPFFYGGKMFKPVRCNNYEPTPYVRKHLPKFAEAGTALDLGCGNLRNTKFAESLGYYVWPFDKGGDYGIKLDLGKEIIPLEEKVDLILCNYVMCFLTNQERRHLAKEIERFSKSGTYLILEMYSAKQGVPYNMNEIRSLFSDWETIHNEKDRFVLKKIS